ncbi:unnamed protein product [Rotaria magnacalcarata]|uniref:Uncharacterized protein n=11 Tax=Rotaria magnacalcarata TaxID=392030 RepID=A0A8S2XE21_9BILA|nr:unnamed protein product [Rotaria magnacalcarata]
MSIIILLTRSNHQRKKIHNKNHLKTKHLSSIPMPNSNPYTDDILYETNKKKLIVDKPRLFPIKSDTSIPCPLYSTSSSYSLPSLMFSAPSPPPPAIPPATPQYLSVNRLYKSYV